MYTFQRRYWPLALLVVGGVFSALVLVGLWQQQGWLGRASALAPASVQAASSRPTTIVRPMRRLLHTEPDKPRAGAPQIVYLDELQQSPQRSIVASDAPTVIGGREAQPGAYPWQVALVVSGASSAYDGQFCGGSLIAPNWVLTAAHCVDGAAPYMFKVVLGRHNLTSSDGEIKEVKRVVVHPNFDPYLLEDDVALVELTTPSDLTAVGLSLPNLSERENRGDLATVTGWGVYSGDLYTGSKVLREGELPLVPLSQCSAGGAWGGLVTSKMLCAGFSDGSVVSCYGDSGGPLMLRDDADQWQQIGIVSWGPYGCSVPGLYSVFTRVASYQDWVATCIANSDDKQCVTPGQNPDASEPNNGPESAPLADLSGAPLPLTFHRPADNDWVKFQAQKDMLYVFETSDLGVRSDTILWLYLQDAGTVAAVNDDGGDGFSSLIYWTAPFSDTMFLEVNHYRSNVFGRASQYTLRTSELPLRTFFPLLAR